MYFSALIDFFLHLDVHLHELIASYGAGIYVILFLIVFLETGAVIMPFLPGDSLLFTAGAFASLGSLHISTLVFLFLLAAILGDTVNYWIGHQLGRKPFEKNSRLFKREYLAMTESFYDKHGASTIILARFLPIVRTFAPFIAGVGRMNYSKFLIYNIFGALIWVLLFVLGGYYFGTIPAVQENFTLVILAIVVISLTPLFTKVFIRLYQKWF